jgi:hypothetical protein
VQVDLQTVATRRTVTRSQADVHDAHTRGTQQGRTCDATDAHTRGTQQGRTCDATDARTCASAITSRSFSDTNAFRAQMAATHLWSTTACTRIVTTHARNTHVNATTKSPHTRSNAGRERIGNALQ